MSHCRCSITEAEHEVNRRAHNIFTRPPQSYRSHRKMPGGSQSHLMRCSDGDFYVVKFPNNPQGNRTLTNELVCANLATALNPPVPSSKIIRVDRESIAPLKITTEWAHETRLCQSGLCFGSRHPGMSSTLRECSCSICGPQTRTLGRCCFFARRMSGRCGRTWLIAGSASKDPNGRFGPLAAQSLIRIRIISRG